MQSPWQMGNINCANVDTTAKQPESLPAYESHRSVLANKDLNEYLFSGFPAEIGMPERNEEAHTPQPLLNPYPDDQLFLSCHRQDGEMTTQKKFFIFDRSGAETRMILGSLRPPIANPTAKPVVKSVHGCSYKSHEDHVIGDGEGSDYHEDTEEINALLYSENDDINETNCGGGEEDELSTGRSPLDEEAESDEEVTSFFHPSKRQKVCEGESVVDTVGTKRARDKIRSKLKLLEKLIPGSQSKDPLGILEEAIDYLKSLKVKAHSLQ